MTRRSKQAGKQAKMSPLTHVILENSDRVHSPKILDLFETFCRFLRLYL
jgi:hypothetical protein